MIHNDEPTDGTGSIWHVIISGLSVCTNGNFPVAGTTESVTYAYCTDSPANATQRLFATLLDPGRIRSHLLEVDTTAGSTDITVAIFSDPSTFDLQGLAVVEDGTFQNLITYARQDGLFDTVALRSAVDAPEPATLALLGVGLAGMVLARRRKSN